MSVQVMIEVGRTDLLHLLSAVAVGVSPDPAIFQRLRDACDDDPLEYDPGAAEAQRIAEVFDEARAELDRGL